MKPIGPAHAVVIDCAQYNGAIGYDLIEPCCKEISSFDDDCFICTADNPWLIRIGIGKTFNFGKDCIDCIQAINKWAL